MIYMRLFTDAELYQEIKDLDVVNLKVLTDAYKSSVRTKTPFEEVLLDEQLLTDENLGKVIAELINSPFLKLADTPIPDEILNIIPQGMARANSIIAFKLDKFIHLATSNPANVSIIRLIEKKTGLPAKTYFATKRDIAQILALYNKDIQKIFDELASREQESNIKNADGQEADPPIIEIVNTLLEYAYQNNASDVHIEPLEKESLIRFRIDGVLHDIIRFSLSIHSRIVTRIKVLSKLRTDEHRIPQDGKISTKIQDESLDIRVSIVPVTKGEKIVMRLLSERARQLSLMELGFDREDMKKIEPAYKKPHGMILVTGPTGSGKTTTLYSILKNLNKRGVNIMTIEDPVEYNIEGVNQIQVNEKTGLTFATGLRSIVRQDPNIILVGEIRDQETAEIAINASLTGHLVLSTLHTNDAPTAFPRLLDMNIEPFLIASTVNVIVAQRLVRKICNHCKLSVEHTTDSLRSSLNDESIHKYFKNKKTFRAYRGKGCKVCHDSTYLGRIGIFEILLLDDEIRAAIVAKADASKIRDIAIKNGMTTMIDDGINKVLEGVTTLEEVLRVTKE